MKKKPFFFSLRYKLQCIILLLVALPLVVVAGTAYMLNARSLSERIMQSNATAANKTATALEYMLEDLKNNSLELFQQSAVYHYLTADNKAASGAAAACAFPLSPRTPPSCAAICARWPGSAARM